MHIMKNSRRFIGFFVYGIIFIGLRPTLWSPPKGEQGLQPVACPYEEELGWDTKCCIPQSTAIVPCPSLASLLSPEQDPLDGLDVSNPVFAQAYPKMVELENSPQWKAIEALIKEVITFLSDGLLEFGPRLTAYHKKQYFQRLFSLIQLYRSDVFTELSEALDVAFNEYVVQCNELEASCDPLVLVSVVALWQSLWHWLHFYLIQEPALYCLLPSRQLHDCIIDASDNTALSVMRRRLSLLKWLYAAIYSEPACIASVDLIKDKDKKNGLFLIKILQSCVYRTSEENAFVYIPVDDKDSPVLDVINRLWWKNLRFYPGLPARYTWWLQQLEGASSASVIECFDLEKEYFAQNLGAKYVCHDLYAQLQAWWYANKKITVQGIKTDDYSQDSLMVQVQAMIAQYVANAFKQEDGCKLIPLCNALTNFGKEIGPELGKMAIKKSQMFDINARARTSILYEMFNTGFGFAVNFWLQMYAEVYKNNSDFGPVAEDAFTQLALRQLRLLWHLQTLGELGYRDKKLWQSEALYYVKKANNSKHALDECYAELDAKHNVHLARMQAMMEQVYRSCVGAAIANYSDSPQAVDVVKNLLPEYATYYEFFMQHFANSATQAISSSVFQRILNHPTFVELSLNKPLFFDITFFIVINFIASVEQRNYSNCCVPHSFFVSDPFQVQPFLEEMVHEEQVKRLAEVTVENQRFGVINNLEKACRGKLTLQHEVAALKQQELQGRQMIGIQERAFWAKSGCLPKIGCLHEAAGRSGIQASCLKTYRVIWEALTIAQQDLLLLEEQNRRLELVAEAQQGAQMFALQLREVSKRLAIDLKQADAMAMILRAYLKSEKPLRCELQRAAEKGFRQCLEEFEMVKIKMQADQKDKRLLTDTESKLRKVIQSQANLEMALVRHAKALESLAIQETDARGELECRLTQSLDVMHQECVSAMQSVNTLMPQERAILRAVENLTGCLRVPGGLERIEVVSKLIPLLKLLCNQVRPIEKAVLAKLLTPVQKLDLAMVLIRLLHPSIKLNQAFTLKMEYVLNLLDIPQDFRAKVWQHYEHCCNQPQVDCGPPMVATTNLAAVYQWEARSGFEQQPQYLQNTLTRIAGNPGSCFPNSEIMIQELTRAMDGMVFCLQQLSQRDNQPSYHLSQLYMRYAQLLDVLLKGNRFTLEAASNKFFSFSPDEQLAMRDFMRGVTPKPPKPWETTPNSMATPGSQWLSPELKRMARCFLARIEVQKRLNEKLRRGCAVDD